MTVAQSSFLFVLSLLHPLKMAEESVHPSHVSTHSKVRVDSPSTAFSMNVVFNFDSHLMPFVLSKSCYYMLWLVCSCVLRSTAEIVVGGWVQLLSEAMSITIPTVVPLHPHPFLLLQLQFQRLWSLLSLLLSYLLLYPQFLPLLHLLISRRIKR